MQWGYTGDIVVIQWWGYAATDNALANGRARYVLAGKSGSGKSRAWAAYCCGVIGTKTWDQIMYCALRPDPHAAERSSR